MFSLQAVFVESILLNIDLHASTSNVHVFVESTMLDLDPKLCLAASVTYMCVSTMLAYSSKVGSPPGNASFHSHNVHIMLCNETKDKMKGKYQAV